MDDGLFCPGRLKDEVILITGSTAGLGAAMAERFALEGAKVVITGRSEDRGRQMRERLEALGTEALFVAMDVSREEDVKAAVGAAADRFGKLTGLVNNAAWIQNRNDGPLTEISTETWRKLTSVELDGVFFASKYGLKAIARAGGGSVLNMSSTGGIRGQVSSHCYGACKGAIQSLTLQMATYYSRYRIRTNCLIVGPVDTGEGRLRAIVEDPVKGRKLRHQYMGRVGQPREVASSAAFLMSADASFINGVMLPVDNGGTIRSHTAHGAINMADVDPPSNDWVALMD